MTVRCSRYILARQYLQSCSSLRSSHSVWALQTQPSHSERVNGSAIAFIFDTTSSLDILTNPIPPECAHSAQCAPFKHHFDECVERVTRQEEDEDFKGPKEDCVEECKSTSYIVAIQNGNNVIHVPRCGYLCANLASQSSTSPIVPPPALPPSSGRNSNKRIANFQRAAFPLSDRLNPSKFTRTSTSIRASPECTVKTNRNSISMMTAPSQLNSLPSVSLVSERSWQGTETRARFLFLLNCVHMVSQGRERNQREE